MEDKILKLLVGKGFDKLNDDNVVYVSGLFYKSYFFRRCENKIIDFVMY